MDFAEHEHVLAGLRRERRWQEAHDALAPLLRSQDMQAVGWARVQLALTYHAESEEKDTLAIQLINSALAVLHDHGREWVMALINGSLIAEAIRDDVQHGSYVDAMKEALSRKDSAILPWRGRMYGRLGYFYTRIAVDWALAEYWLHQAVAFYKKHIGPFNERDRQCQLRISLSALGDVMLHIGRHDGARACLAEAEATAHDDGAQSSVDYLRGRLLQTAGNDREAIKHFSSALTSAEAKNLHVLTCMAAESLARAHSNLGEFAVAEALILPLKARMKRGGASETVLRLQRLLKDMHGEEEKVL
ncbi:MAG TPA: hypothetical protein VGK74_02240 [Symbiobacteriaceae bacterium]|jgi:tetratricopeptide (TPR) repeat protein